MCTLIVDYRMVQGNSARRKELAAGRRQDRKDEIVRKTQGAFRATPTEARARLLHYAGRLESSTGSSTDLMVAFVAKSLVADSNSTEKDVCQSWFRTGSCPRKRCCLSHDATISHLVGVPEIAGESSLPSSDAAPDEGGRGGKGSRKGNKGKKGSKKKSSTTTTTIQALPPMDCVPLSEVNAGGKLSYDKKLRTQRRQKSNLMFVAFGNELVFDSLNPYVFARWSDAVKEASSVAAAESNDGSHKSGETKRGGAKTTLHMNDESCDTETRETNK